MSWVLQSKGVPKELCDKITLMLIKPRHVIKPEMLIRRKRTLTRSYIAAERETERKESEFLPEFRKIVDSTLKWNGIDKNTFPLPRHILIDILKDASALFKYRLDRESNGEWIYKSNMSLILKLIERFYDRPLRKGYKVSLAIPYICLKMHYRLGRLREDRRPEHWHTSYFNSAIWHNIHDGDPEFFWYTHLAE